MKALVTGGAGFIGSSLSEALVNAGWEVTVLDNLSTGSKKNLQQILNGPRADGAKIVVGDCTQIRSTRKMLRHCETIFHFAANPEVRVELTDPADCFRQNIYATYVMLEAFRHSRAETIIFASSSTVYGEANLLPTPENYSPLEPISVYAASKLACEALVTSYCHTFRKHAVILRLANVVGPRVRRGVVRDFIRRLRQDPQELTILGDGTQTKSYIYIDDCIAAIIRAMEVSRTPVEVFNVGSMDQVDVRTIAGIVAEEMGLKGVELKFDQSILGGRGWQGDVKKMLLDIGKLESKGWSPKCSSQEAVLLTVRSVLKSRV
jgi:UDP-glucose 4-epimerase